MSDSFSSTDLEQLTRATKLLLAPLDCESVDDWRRAVNRQIRPLLGADSAGFQLPLADGLPMFSEEHDPEELARYTDYPPPPTAAGVPGWRRTLDLGVSTLDDIYGDEIDVYRGSAYYNDYAAPNGARELLVGGFAPEGAPAHAMASLQLWRDGPRSSRFGDRERSLLSYLFPAFQSGVEALLRWRTRAADLLTTFDALEQAAVVIGADGHVLHRTGALEAIMAADPERRELEHALRSVSAAVLPWASDEFSAISDGPRQAVRTVRTRTARYRLVGLLHGSRAADGPPLVIVGLGLMEEPRPTVGELRERFGLTRRQADVAMLLLQRQSDREIAEALVISHHTARNHTEAVLNKLDVRDRRQVEKAIRDEFSGRR